MEEKIPAKTETTGINIEAALSYVQLLQMLGKGIVGVVDDNSNIAGFPFGFRSGRYLGAPGKDIFFSLPSLSDVEFYELAVMLAKSFPMKAPGNHVKWAACIRYVYGCFEKQGCLRSNEDLKRMKNDDADWSLPMKFMDKVALEFKKNENYYGLTIHHEMLAHRYGDRAIIDRNKEILNTALKNYKLSYEYAKKCKSYKHMFTPFYWAGGYFFEMGMNDMAKECYLKCIKNMEKYCPDARGGYREKASMCLKRLSGMFDKSEKKEFMKWFKRRKNKCLKKVSI